MAPKVRFTIDMVKVFDKAYQAESRELRNALRPVLSDAGLKREYGLRVIEQIRENVQDKGLDKNGKPWTGKATRYSESYKESAAFKIYGKSGDVNMTLSGEMMASMQPVVASGRMLTITFVDKLNNDKAHGHITGHDGKWKVKRDFFGIPMDQQVELLRETIKDFRLERLPFTVAEEISMETLKVSQGGPYD